MKTQPASKEGRKYVIQGRVQGVGFRAFVEETAARLGVCGWARNCGDGSVEVYATGERERLAELAGYLRQGPRMADVRRVEETEAAVEECTGFRIRH